MKSACPKCGIRHRGPRAIDQLRVEAQHFLIRSYDMAPAVAAEFLRTQWMGGALELSGWCINCAMLEIAASAPGACKGELERTAALVTEQQIEDQMVEGKPIHLCKVFPLFRSKEKVAKDLLEVGSPKGDAS